VDREYLTDILDRQYRTRNELADKKTARQAYIVQRAESVRSYVTLQQQILDEIEVLTDQIGVKSYSSDLKNRTWLKKSHLVPLGSIMLPSQSGDALLLGQFFSQGSYLDVSPLPGEVVLEQETGSFGVQFYYQIANDQPVNELIKVSSPNVSLNQGLVANCSNETLAQMVFETNSVVPVAAARDFIVDYLTPRVV